MSSVNRNLIEYNGINAGICKNSKFAYFQQMNQDFSFCVPMQKPDIEQIVKVWANPCILQQKIVATPKGTSLEGQKVTGYKVMIMGEITYKVEYVALETTQGLHTAHSTIPFCGYVVLPETFNVNAMLNTSVVLEDMHAEQLDNRCIYNNVTMMLVADLC